LDLRSLIFVAAVQAGDKGRTPSAGRARRWAISAG